MKSERKFVMQVFEDGIFTGRYVNRARKKYLGYFYETTSVLKDAQVWKGWKKCNKLREKLENELEPWSSKQKKGTTLTILETTDPQKLRMIKLKRLK